MTRRSISFVTVAVLALNIPAAAQNIGDPPQAKNMRLVAYNDLQARSAYQPIIQRQGERYIAYIGHHGASYVPKPVNSLTGQGEFNGTSIVDVTNPAQPKYLAHIPGQEGGPESGGAQMVRACDGKALPKGDPNAVYLLRTFGTTAHEIWNVADIRRRRSSSPGSAGIIRTPTRAGGSAIPVSPSSSPACRAGARSACLKSTTSPIRPGR